ncbi:MAG: hydroxysqualene dehydroxylase HpnE [Burkholderiales bacterium]
MGGGYAGMAAAVTLADAGVPATVYEAAAELGGRARRVVVNDVALDNGLHILIGGYRETLRLIGAVHADPEKALARFPLDWHIYRRFRLKAAPLPAPLHLACGLLAARGVGWGERIAAAKFMRAMRAQSFRLPRDMTVDALLSAHRQGTGFRRYLWEPLCVSALNTAPSVASAQVFLNVLRDGLDAGRGAGDILLSRGDLTALFPEPAADYVRSRGGRVHVSRIVDRIAVTAGGVDVTTRAATEHHSHAICAVSPHRAARLLSSVPQLGSVVASVGRLRYQPIYSVYLQLEGAVKLPAPMLGMSGIAQWIFDRDAICGQRGLVAAVISSTGAHEAMTQDGVAREVYDELDRELGPLPRLAWHRVIAEKRATFECKVGLERPAITTPVECIHLAGDYTQSDYPATIEAAVRSGIAAARQVLSHASRADAASRR